MAYYWKHTANTHGDLYASATQQGVHPGIDPESFVPSDVLFQLFLIEQDSHKVVGHLQMTSRGGQWIDDGLTILSLDGSITFEAFYRHLNTELLPSMFHALAEQTKGYAIRVGRGSGITQYDFATTSERRQAVREEDASLIPPELARLRQMWNEHAADAGGNRWHHRTITDSNSAGTRRVGELYESPKVLKSDVRHLLFLLEGERILAEFQVLVRGQAWAAEKSGWVFCELCLDDTLSLDDFFRHLKTAELPVELAPLRTAKSQAVRFAQAVGITSYRFAPKEAGREALRRQAVKYSDDGRRSLSSIRMLWGVGRIYWDD